MVQGRTGGVLYVVPLSASSKVEPADSVHLVTYLSIGQSKMSSCVLLLFANVAPPLNEPCRQQQRMSARGGEEGGKIPKKVLIMLT